MLSLIFNKAGLVLKTFVKIRISTGSQLKGESQFVQFMSGICLLIL